MEDAQERPQPAEPAAADQRVFTCPNCSELSEFDDVPPDAVLECPACGTPFSATAEAEESDDAEDAHRHDEEEDTEAASEREEELDGLRIRQLSAIRRAVSRQRSYAIVGWAVCLVAVIKLVELTIRHVRLTGWDREPVGYLMFAAAGLWGCAHFLKRAREYGRELSELSRSALTEPQSPPDFSTLSDGSQRIRNLEEM